MILAIFVAVSALPVTLPVTSPVKVASVPFVPLSSTIVPLAAFMSPVTSPVNEPAIFPAPVMVGEVKVLFVNVCVFVN